MRTVLRSCSQSVTSVQRYLQCGNEIADSLSSVQCPLYVAICWDLRGGMPLNPQPPGSQPFRECWLLCKAPIHHLVQDLTFQKSMAFSRYLYFSGVHLRTIHFVLSLILLDFYLDPMNIMVKVLFEPLEYMTVKTSERSVSVQQRHIYLFLCKRCCILSIFPWKLLFDPRCTA